ncbi:GntR family transcriptional regulator [Microbacterium sp.]|uniref:GntR family transcriptional regulator n=1 Tax=Microbacterium sp. TaxID=51671 RepID=UPI002E377E72|nr:GntR family transcriptional regulator [Microbacterium sp.]HEX5731056.1 GntR family transcriptional regulator [Microbacterium sp.]
MTSLAEVPQPKAELVDLIAHDIREGVYHPRERLIEVELCARYRTSRNAVRGALIELAALGLVEREANRGARVRPVSIDEAIESTEVRLSLQAMCAGRAATRVTDADRAELTALLEELRSSVEDGDRARTAAANSEISRVIRRISGHQTASRIIETLQSQVRINWYPYQLPDRRVDSMHEYERVVEAVIAGDEAGALEAAYRHRDNVLDALRGIRDATAASVD